MKKRILLVAALFFIAAGFTFSLGRGTLKGRVSDAEGKPLAEVKVYLANSDVFTETASDGTFVLENVKKPQVQLVFTHPEYIQQSVQISLEESSSRMIQVVLDEINPMLRTIREEITVTAEADSIIARAREDIRNERLAAITDIKNQVGELSLQIAEKVLREKLSDDSAQRDLVNKLVAEADLKAS